MTEGRDQYHIYADIRDGSPGNGRTHAHGQVGNFRYIESHDERSRLIAEDVSLYITPRLPDTDKLVVDFGEKLDVPDYDLSRLVEPVNDQKGFKPGMTPLEISGSGAVHSTDDDTPFY